MIRGSIIKKLSKIFTSRICTITCIGVAIVNIFLSGYFSDDGQFESIANYSSQVVLNNTQNKKYCAITVQSTSESGPIADSYSEYNNLNGVFSNKNVTFASAMNLYNNDTKKKECDIYIESNKEQISDNLSIFYLGPIGSKQTNNGFKHYIYPLETMFEDHASKYDLVQGKYVAYISQSHADKLLASFGETKNENGVYDIEKYQTLLENPDRNKIDISFNSVNYSFAILNIFLQRNYYYEGLNEILGDFIAASYYLPLNMHQNQKNIYFLNEHSYQNQYFMKHIRNVYKNGKFDVELNERNIVGRIDNEYLESFYFRNLKSQPAYNEIILLVLSFFLVSFALLIIFKKEYYKSNKFIFILISIVFSIYLLFQILSLCELFVLLFTYKSCKIFFSTLCLILCFIFIFKNKKLFIVKKEKMNKNECYEIDI